MKYVIEEPQTEPFTPHALSSSEWEVLFSLGKIMKRKSIGDYEARKLFRDWLNDKILYHNQVKPLILYTIISNIIKHRKIIIGASYQDPRVPLLIYMPSGSGKYVILEAMYELNEEVKKIIKDKIDDKFIAHKIINRRFNYDKKQKVTAEALLGTVIRSSEGWVAQMGVEATASVLVINEASTFFNSENENMNNVFPYVCEALDPIGSQANIVSKQLTGRPALLYRTETNFVLFCQPERANLNEGIITSGTLPRFLIVYSPVSERYHHEVLEFRMSHTPTVSPSMLSELASFLLSILSENRDFVLSKKAKSRVVYEMTKLTDFVSDDRVAKLYISTAYQRVSNMIIKMAAVNCSMRYDYVISELDIKRAAIDFRSAFITAMAFFTNFVNFVHIRKQRIYELMEVIRHLWAVSPTRGVIAINSLYDELKKDKKWTISERSIRNLLSAMETARLLKYDRGVGRKPGYVIDIQEFTEDEYYRWLNEKVD